MLVFIVEVRERDEKAVILINTNIKISNKRIAGAMNCQINWPVVRSIYCNE